ncbi:MAG: trypsin-like peptidase domain-containing protein [Anaerolineales bacterium]
MNSKFNRKTIIIFSILVLFTLTACGLFGATASEVITGQAPEANIRATPTESSALVDAPAVTTTRPETSGIPAGASIDLQERLIEVYQKANPSVVYIITTSGGGSGFVFNEEGYIVTNHHVVSNSNNYEVVYADGNRSRASLVGSDPDSDLAVLQVDQLPEGVKPLPLGRFEDVAVGQFVIAIGNPFGEQGSMSLGIISGLGRSLTSQRDIGMGSTYSLPQVIQTDAPINPGNSGGPLLNLNGEVVGINSAIATFTGANSGVGFSIPVAAVEKIVPSLIEKGQYEYPYIGATFASELSLEAVDLYGLPQFQGAYVLGISSGSPAERAGLRPADVNTGRGGDLIVEIDDQPIRNFSDLNSYLVFQTSVGQTIDITVLRGNQRVNVPLTLGERP